MQLNSSNRKLLPDGAVPYEASALEYAKAAKVYWILDTDRSGVTDAWMTEWEKHVEVVM